MSLRAKLAIALGLFLWVSAVIYATGYVPPPFGWGARNIGPDWECGARSGVCFKDVKRPNPEKPNSK